MTAGSQPRGPCQRTPPGRLTCAPGWKGTRPPRPPGLGPDGTALHRARTRECEPSNRTDETPGNGERLSGVSTLAPSRAVASPSIDRPRRESSARARRPARETLRRQRVNRPRVRAQLSHHATTPFLRARGPVQPRKQVAPLGPSPHPEQPIQCRMDSSAGIEWHTSAARMQSGTQP